MRHKTYVMLLSLLVGGTGSLQAQLPDWVNQILLATQLPVVANEVRQDGVANADVISVLDAMRRANIPAHDAKVVLDSARAAHRDNGPVDNFGAFVQSQLAAGKRGTDLAAAIRAEHARQGKGKAGKPGASNASGSRGQSNAQGRGPDAARGRSGNAKPPTDTGAGKSGGNRGRGRPPQR